MKLMSLHWQQQHALHDLTHYYVNAGLQAKEGLYHSRGPNVLHRQKHVESHL